MPKCSSILMRFGRMVAAPKDPSFLACSRTISSDSLETSLRRVIGHIDLVRTRTDADPAPPSGSVLSFRAR